jgi:hypothetical protein
MLLFCGILQIATAQEVPSKEENIEWLTTFSKDAHPKWGDDDFVQIFFFTIPKSETKPFYIRVFDPDVGGKNDQKNGPYNSKTTFSVFGGQGCYSNNAARSVNPEGNYKSGNYLASATFGHEAKYDNSWFTFGPFNPRDGEPDEKLNAFIFKIVCEGISGDDGNHYRYFLSYSPDKNIPVLGGNAFTYEYSFMLKENAKSTANLYPFADEKVVSITQHNFDFDNDGYLKLYTVAKNGHNMGVSGDNKWAESKHVIIDKERNKSLNMKIIKRASFKNDMVIFITNQYNEPLPFFASPLGGKPKYQFFIEIEYDQR